MFFFLSSSFDKNLLFVFQTASTNRTEKNVTSLIPFLLCVRRRLAPSPEAGNVHGNDNEKEGIGEKEERWWVGVPVLVTNRKKKLRADWTRACIEQNCRLCLIMDDGKWKEMEKKKKKK